MTNRQAAIQIIRTLRKAGFKALLAGGCVRDTLLGKKPKDYDVATDAKPEQICRIFLRTIKVGAKFGVIIVLIDKHQIEAVFIEVFLGGGEGGNRSDIVPAVTELLTVNDLLRFREPRKELEPRPVPI